MYRLPNYRLTRDQTVSLLFAAAAVLTGVLTAIFWNRLEDTPGMVLAYLTAGLLVMAIIHNWTQPVRLLILALAGVFGFVVFAVLHNLAFAAAELTAAYPIMSGLFRVIDGLSFLLAVLVAPAATAISLVGAAVNWWRQRFD